MDQKELSLTALLNEFSARWQELQNIENAMMTWSTIYATALFVTTAWLLGRPEPARKLFQRSGDLTAYGLLLLCITNMMFFLAMNSMSYRIQEIALYIEDVLAPKIRALSDPAFNRWEQFRRNSPAAWGRDFYIGLQALLPIAISGILLTLYFQYFWKKRLFFSLHSLLAFLTAFFLFTALFSSLSMSWDVKSRWESVLAPVPRDTTGKSAKPPSVPNRVPAPGRPDTSKP